MATREVYSDASIGIINIDAHFDTRPDEPPTSGTMFREILDNDENVDYLVLGLAQGGNTRALYDYAKTIILFMSMRTNFYIKCHRLLKIK